MAERKPLFIDATQGFPEEMATSDSATFGSLTVESGGDITMSGGGEVTGLPATPSATGAASKEYVDSVAAGLDAKESVVAASIGQGNVVLASAVENGDLLDGVTLATGDRILIAEQTTGSEDGIYIVAGSGAPTRASDAATGAEFAGSFIFVEEGTANADIGFVCTNDDGADVVGTHDLVFVRFSSLSFSGGDGIDISGSTISVDLTTNPGLEFSGNKLRIDVADGNELSLDANGLNVEGVPTLFNVGATAVGATVTAPNLDTLTDGSNADALHTHSAMAVDEAERVEFEINAGTGGVAAGDPVYVSANDTVLPSDNTAPTNGRKTVGIARAAATVGNPVSIVSSGRVDGVLSGATAGAFQYVSTTNGLTETRPTASGSMVYMMGIAVNATDMVMRIQFFGVNA